jgi:uncharacterized cupin superfamily protein
VTIAHWDDVPKRHQTAGHLGATWRDLGRAAGSVEVGVKRIEVDPDRWSTPAHVHGSAEEIFFVLGGSGISWQDGKSYEVGPGDCLVHLRETEPHTLKAGVDGLDVLTYGHRRWDEAAHLPRAGVSWLADSWVDAGHGLHPWAREAAAGPPELAEPSERPATIVNVADVPVNERDGATVAYARRDLGRAAGSELTGLKHLIVPDGKLNVPPHCHSAEEELFVVLEGEGVLELTPTPDLASDGVEPSKHPVRRGSVVSRRAGTGVAHAFRAGHGGLTLLAYGTREPNDICYYPRSRKIFWRGVGLVGRVEHLDYWIDED